MSGSLRLGMIKHLHQTQHNRRQCSRSSPEILQISPQSCSKLIVDLNHDRVFVVVDVSEEMNEWYVSSSHRDDFHL